MINIRRAEIKDLPSILELVVELAVFEKEPEAVTASLYQYEEAFKEGIFEGLVVEKQGLIIGMAIFYMTFSTWKGKMLYLEDLYIQKEHRQSGIGQKLFDAFLKIAKKKKAKLTKWQVLDWNTPAIKFYYKNGASIEKNWWNGKINITNDSKNVH